MRLLRRGALVVAAIAVAAAVAAPPGRAGTVDDVRSIVVFGDSIAAGEGARSGYVYQDRVVLPSWSSPRAGEADRPRCGRTSEAYGVAVAAAFGAEIRNLACSGASFERGIVLDERFDRARPDLALVTAGANSVEFERVFAYCALVSAGLAEREAERVVTAATVREALGDAVGIGFRRLLGSTTRPGSTACTDAAPGAYLQRTVIDRVDDVADDARELAEAIRARGRALGGAPTIVFTTYPDPLPRAASALLACPDAAGLGSVQLAFLHDLLDELNDRLRDAVEDVPGVVVADAGPAFAGHRWCDPDPWFYGPSILVSDPASRAPFHPTPAGQRALAAAVLGALGRAPADAPGLI